jgi:hypothetical protein
MLKINLPLFLYCAVLVAPLQAQNIIEHIPNHTLNEYYTLHSNGTVTDINTGLIWQRCSLGQNWDGSTCTGNAATYTWQAALQQSSGSTLAGYDDWRLPSVEELRSLVAYDRFSPAINNAIFPNTPISWYWSSSPNANTSDGGWIVSFYDGFDGIHSRGNAYHVRIVRSGH